VIFVAYSFAGASNGGLRFGLHACNASQHIDRALRRVKSLLGKD